MNLIHRAIDFENDRDYVLECHCRINYECDCPWARKIPYADYRENWFSLAGQVEGFYNYLMESARDPRTVAEIIETEDGQTIGYFWVPFCEDAENDFCFADVQDIYIEEEFCEHGIAAELFRYAEEKAKLNGASVIRSGTGCENIRSIRLHEKLGFYTYRYEFEKVL